MRGTNVTQAGKMGEIAPFTRKCRKKECKQPRDRLSGHDIFYIKGWLYLSLECFLFSPILLFQLMIVAGQDDSWLRLAKQMSWSSFPLSLVLRLCTASDLRSCSAQAWGVSSLSLTGLSLCWVETQAGSQSGVVLCGDKVFAHFRFLS